MPDFQDSQIESLRALHLTALASTELNWCFAAARPPAGLIPTGIASVYAPPSIDCSSMPGILLQHGQQPLHVCRQTSAHMPTALCSNSSDFSTTSDVIQHSFRETSAPVPTRFCTVPTHFGTRSEDFGNRSEKPQHRFRVGTAAVPVRDSTRSSTSGTGSSENGAGSSPVCSCPDRRRYQFRCTTAAGPTRDSTNAEDFCSGSGGVSTCSNWPQEKVQPFPPTALPRAVAGHRHQTPL
jgi:hypothetical protein